ncbi:selenocysteine-specific translation elongation factor [Ammoniphilus oxalaticus]|uniref:Selenocysteine-specific elongation factor n=1 Tax=Ammoniphilus oxalaticus TaxID=66863 RepID=A0A419SFZ7_9BACL|nr:selenocysteine-specific translation elongation factor [Ammoniphilus oxalaticus]RKD22707.1 selenocysteine-specific translation elongation factor [Ammoniphilus oxalaticus]
MDTHYTIGIAGHIDHGKTSLTKKLTNIDTDRLKEERERGVSIELGFAPLQLPSGKQVGVVDVPGHERFIRQMIAGAAGIDLVILVIAADEGIMPQTREHFDIIRFLGIEKGIIALTKTDLVDEEWIEMVKDEAREWVEDSFLEDAPIVPVSSQTGTGIEQLLETIETELHSIPERETSEPFRMPIDRVFTKKGAGAVVTGTIYEGEITEGDTVEVFPIGEKVKIRQLNVHHHSVEKAYAGQRTALNLSGIDFKDMERGYALTAPEYFRKTDRIDIHFHMLPHLDFKVKQRMRVRLHIATTEIMGKIIFYDRNELEPGEEALCQLQLEGEIIAKAGDPFILRRLSPTATLGGGKVLSPYGQRRKFGEKSVALLELLNHGDEWEMLQYVLAEDGFSTIEEIDFQLALGQAYLQQLVERYEQEQRVKQFGSYVVLADSVQEWVDRIKTTLMKYHHQHPMRTGMKKSELRSRYFPDLADRLWREFVVNLREEAVVDESDEAISLKKHQPKIPTSIQPTIEKLENTLKKEELTVSSWDDLAKSAGLKQQDIPELKAYLIEQKGYVAMGSDFLVDASVYESAVTRLKEGLPADNPFTPAQVREIISVSRKYLIPFLESLDQRGLTKRVDNERVWIKRAEKVVE